MLMRITFPNLDSIISEVPNFFGFVPTESLVLVATHREEGTTSSRIPVVAARTDLPQPEHSRELADYFAAVCGANTADMGIAVLISDTPMHEHHALVTELATTFTRHNLGLHAVWTTLRPGETWCSYHDDEGHGIIHDTSASSLAAAAAVAGFSRYNSRAEMEASLAPVPDPQRADWAQRLAQHSHTDTSAATGRCRTRVHRTPTTPRQAATRDRASRGRTRHGLCQRSWTVPLVSPG